MVGRPGKSKSVSFKSPKLLLVRSWMVGNCKKKEQKHKS